MLSKFGEFFGLLRPSTIIIISISWADRALMYSEFCDLRARSPAHCHYSTSPHKFRSKRVFLHTWLWFQQTHRDHWSLNHWTLCVCVRVIYIHVRESSHGVLIDFKRNPNVSPNIKRTRRNNWPTRLELCEIFCLQKRMWYHCLWWQMRGNQVMARMEKIVLFVPKQGRTRKGRMVAGNFCTNLMSSETEIARGWRG